ncbi:MAG: ribose-phosphate diphosphokinase, partial [Patescibacteria group bacterium]|nr:ribose-phosphate diphosphokinase [Patescibacteria group bacterium]
DGDLVIASPDKGGVPKATFYAELLKASGVAIVYKERDVMKANESTVMDMIGSVKDKNVLIVDDMIDTAGTICNAAKLIRDRGAKSVSVAATHGIFSGSAPERIKAANFDRIFITDTVPIRKEMLEIPQLTVVSIAKLLAEAIKRIYKGESLSEELIPKSHEERN